MKSILLFTSFVIAGTSCSEEKGKPTNLPMIRPKVEEATPEGLKSGASLKLSSDILSGIKQILTEDKSNLGSGQACNGIVNCTLTAVDSRMDSINGRSEESPRKCIDDGAKTKSAGFLDKRLSLNVKCSDDFGRGGGLVFGIENKVYSGAVMLRQKEADVASRGDFMNSYFVNYDLDKEDIHYLSMLSARTQDENIPLSTTAVELKTNRLSKSFELYLAGQIMKFGCGTQMIADSNEIYIKAKYLVGKQITTTNCSEAVVHEFCLNATDLSEKESCSLSEDSFTIEGVTLADIFDNAEQVFEDIQFQSISEGVRNFNEN